MKTITILLVDDNELYRANIRMGLKGLIKHNLQPVIHEAADLQTALALMNSKHVDLVITDGIFPEAPGTIAGTGHGKYGPEDFRGNKIAQHARQLEIPVVGISETPEGFKNVKTVFKKPFKINDLINEIINHIQ